MAAASAAIERREIRTIPTAAALTAIVAVGTVVQTVLARLLPSPSVFPDEYLYSQLGRSLATAGRLRVHGISAHFLPVLEPILTAPIWLVHDVGTSYRLVQAENALAMSLAAVPTYLIVRRLRIGRPLALGLAALAVAGPPMAFVGMFLSEPFAYPLALGTIAATLRAIERPTPRAQALLLGLCALVVLTRLQLAVLPLCAAIVLVLVGLREQRLRAALREHALFLGALITAATAGIVLALLRGFGYYHLLSHVAGSAGAARLAGVDGYIALLAAGSALAPSALPGVALAMLRPRFRAELVFGVLATVTTAAILLESVLWEHEGRVQGRYFCYLLPLLGIGSALRWSRDDRRPVPEIAVAAALAAVAALLPLNGYATDSAQSVSPSMYALSRLVQLVHSPAVGAAVFAAAVTALVGVGAACSLARRGALVVVGCSLAGSFLLLLGAVSWSGRLATDLRERSLPADAEWIDHAVDGNATMLVGARAPRGEALATLFWNPSVTRVVRLPRGPSVDGLAEPAVHVERSGALLVGGRALTGPLIVESAQATTVELAGASYVRGWSSSALWRPRGTAHLGVVVGNRLNDGRVLRTGAVELWSMAPRLAGWIEVRVGVPARLLRAHVRFGSRGHAVAVTASPGDVRLVRVAACGRSPWQGGFAADPVRVEDGTLLTPLLGVPRYVPDPRACA